MKINGSVGKSFTLLDNSEKNGFFLQLKVLYSERFRRYRSFPPALRCFTILYIVYLRWYWISPFKIISKCLGRGSNYCPLDLKSDILPMSHSDLLRNEHISKNLYLECKWTRYRNSDKCFTHTEVWYTQLVNTYSSQVKINVTRKGERGKGLKLEDYIIFCYASYFCTNILCVNWCKEACWATSYYFYVNYL